MFTDRFFYPKTGIDKYIYGGEEAKPGQFPFLVSIRLKEATNNLTHQCGGSIVSDRFILTAGHCIYERNAENYTILLGAHHKFDIDNVYKIDVKKFILHEKFIYNKIGLHDIGLIELAEPINFTQNVTPITLNKKFINETVEAIICGWGESNVSTVEMKLEILSSRIVSFSG